MNGVHTCDKRRTRTYIEETFPGFDIEEGFAEKDRLWDSLKRETHAEIDARIKRVLDMIFETDKEQCKHHPVLFINMNSVLQPVISITAHGGVFGALLRVANSKQYTLPVGGSCSCLIC